MGIDICMILVIPPLEDRTPSLISITSLIGPHLFAYSKQDGDAFSTYTPTDRSRQVASRLVVRPICWHMHHISTITRNN